MQKLQQHATTLVELLTILLLISAMVSYAVPAFSKWIDAHKQRSLQEKLLYQLQAARSQAVTRGETLEICASADGLQCQGSWSEGWLLKTAKTGDILMAEQITLSNSALQWSGYRDQVLFRSNGQTPSSNGRFYLCHDGEIVWQLMLSRQGRIRLASLSENQADSDRCR